MDIFQQSNIQESLESFSLRALYQINLLYALYTGICSFHKLSPCWWAHAFSHRNPGLQFVRRVEEYLSAVYHLLRLRIWCKIRVQAPQALIRNNIHNSCWSARNDTLFLQILSSINKLYATVVTVNQSIVYCQRIEVSKSTTNSPELRDKYDGRLLDKNCKYFINVSPCSLILFPCMRQIVSDIVCELYYRERYYENTQ